MRILIVLCLSLMLLACSARSSYLKEATDHANRDQVAQRLGAPDKIHPLTTGGEMWTYRSCGGSAYAYGYSNKLSGIHQDGDSYYRCTDWILTFDQSGTLRAWHKN